MARPTPPAELEFPGADSFLDVVTNIIGILIILVVILGVRSRQAGIAAGSQMPAESQSPALAEREYSLTAEMHALARQIGGLAQTAGARRSERAALATIVAAAERELATRREELNEDQRRSFDQDRVLSGQRAVLARLQSQREQVAAARPAVQTVVSYSTSLAKSVEGKELHFQLREGRVTYVPLEALVEKFKAVAQQKMARLQDSTELTDTIGPVDGFFLRYTLQRKEVSWERAKETGERGGRWVQLAKYELIPVGSAKGETLDEALGPRSQFRGRLDQAGARDWTITLWTYPDSFETFRGLRKELYQRGFAVAGRPLPDGVPIGGSPEGSRSAAQ